MKNALLTPSLSPTEQETPNPGILGNLRAIRGFLRNGHSKLLEPRRLRFESMEDRRMMDGVGVGLGVGAGDEEDVSAYVSEEIAEGEAVPDEGGVDALFGEMGEEEIAHEREALQEDILQIAEEGGWEWVDLEAMQVRIESLSEVAIGYSGESVRLAETFSSLETLIAEQEEELRVAHEDESVSEDAMQEAQEVALETEKAFEEASDLLISSEEHSIESTSNLMAAQQVFADADQLLISCMEALDKAEAAFAEASESFEVWQRELALWREIVQERLYPPIREYFAAWRAWYSCRDEGKKEALFEAREQARETYMLVWKEVRPSYEAYRTSLYAMYADRTDRMNAQTLRDKIIEEKTNASISRDTAQGAESEAQEILDAAQAAVISAREEKQDRLTTYEEATYSLAQTQENLTLHRERCEELATVLGDNQTERDAVQNTISAIETTLGELQTELQTGQSSLDAALAAREDAKPIYPRMHVSTDGRHHITVRFRSPHDATRFEIGRVGSDGEVGGITVDHPGGMRDDTVTMRIDTKYRGCAVDMRMIDPATGQPQQSSVRVLWNPGPGELGDPVAQLDWEETEAGKLEQHPIVPMLKVVGMEDDNVLLYAESPGDRTKIVMEGGGVFATATHEHAGGTEGTPIPLAFNTHAEPGVYVVRLYDGVTGGHLRSVELSWDGDDLSLMDGEDQFTAPGERQGLKMAQMRVMSPEEAVREAVLQEAAQVDRENILAKMQQQSLLTTIQLWDADMAHGQRQELYTRCGFAISHDELMEYFYGVYPHFRPENFNAYINSIYDPASGFSRGSVESAQYNQYMDMKGSYEEDWYEYSNVMGTVMQAGVEYYVQARQGVDIGMTGIENAIQHGLNNGKVNELRSIGINLPTANEVRSCARKLYDEMTGEFLNDQEGSRLLAIRSIPHGNDVKILSSNARADNGYANANESQSRRLARAHRLAADYVMAGRDSRARAVAVVSGSANIQRARAIAAANGNVAMTEDELLELAEDIDDLAGQDTDAGTIIAGIVARTGAVVDAAERATAEGVLEAVMEELSPAQREQFFIDFGENLNTEISRVVTGSTLIASAGISDSQSGFSLLQEQIQQEAIISSYRPLIERLEVAGDIASDTAQAAKWVAEGVARTILNAGEYILDEGLGRGIEAAMFTAEQAVHMNSNWNPMQKLYALSYQAILHSYTESVMPPENASSIDLEAYHKEMSYDRNINENTDGRLFEMHLGSETGSKPLVVLVLGNKQELDDLTGEVGLNKLYGELAQNENIDVLKFRVGRAWEEMTSIIDHSLHTSVVFRHTQNILEHFVDGKGTFAGMAHPTEIIFAGYSYGAGTIDRLMENWNDTKLKDVSVAATAYIDGVQLGVANFGHGIDVRPNHSHQHLHIWQDDTGALPPGSGPIHGEGLGFVLDDRGDYREYVANNGDREVFLEQSNHLDVDNNDRTFREIKDLLEGKLDILLQLP